MKFPIITKIRKSLLYSRMRQYFPMPEDGITDDSDRIGDAEVVRIDWPINVIKPRVGIVQDNMLFPRWTKYARFLANNSFPFEIYNIHSHNWLEKAENLDVIIGIPSNAFYDLQEIRKKYYLLETCLRKTCYPSMKLAFLYEDKNLEAFLSNIYKIPYIRTYISYDKKDALHLIENLTYPVISKVVPSSGSIGVEMVHSKEKAKKIVEQAFSQNGRKTHVIYSRQKNYIYFQDYIPNDGFDIRVIVVGNRAFGYYRKVLQGDFRASGMQQEEKRSLPEEAIKIARKVNKIINSPQLAVDMLHGLDDKYYINEFSPLCGMSTHDQLQVDGIPGGYVFDNDNSYHFEPGTYWVHELALKEFFVNYYLQKVTNGSNVKKNQNSH
jgi:glutathione synthase/RimK-type ligase-like ATP-grasp enzyme